MNGKWIKAAERRVEKMIADIEHFGIRAEVVDLNKHNTAVAALAKRIERAVNARERRNRRESVLHNRGR
jgi:hypothetical protein